jgi:hypothetical protein
LAVAILAVAVFPWALYGRSADRSTVGTIGSADS